MLWELLAGHRLWQGMGEAHIVHHLAGGMPIPNLPPEPGRPPVLDRICARALAINPGDRYATAADLESDLQGRAGRHPADSHARGLGDLLASAFSEARAEREALIARALESGQSPRAVALRPQWAQDIESLLPTVDGGFDVTGRRRGCGAAAAAPPPPPPARRGGNVAVAVTTIGLAAVGLVLVVAGVQQQRMSSPEATAPPPAGHRPCDARRGDRRSRRPSPRPPSLDCRRSAPVAAVAPPPPRPVARRAGAARRHLDARAARGSRGRDVSVRGAEDRAAPARVAARDRRKRSVQMKASRAACGRARHAGGGHAGACAEASSAGGRRGQPRSWTKPSGVFSAASSCTRRATSAARWWSSSAPTIWCPTYKILYNLGQVSYQRHDYASALRYFRQYLGEGDEAIPLERQKEVATEINRLSPRVGSLEIQAFDDGAEVFVDDVLMGTTPAGR